MSAGPRAAAAWAAGWPSAATEIVASSAERLCGRRKKDYAAETAGQALETQAEVMGMDPAGPDDYDEADEVVGMPDESEIAAAA